MMHRRALLGGATAALAVVALPLQSAIPVRPRQVMTDFWLWVGDLRPRDAAEADRLIREGIAERLGPLPAHFRSTDSEFTVTIYGYEGAQALSRFSGLAHFRVTLPLSDGPWTGVEALPLLTFEA